MLRPSILLSVASFLAAQLAHADTSARAGDRVRGHDDVRLWRAHDALPAHARTPVEAAREQLLRHADVWGLSQAVIAKLDVDGVRDTGVGGIVVRFRHREGDLEVRPDRLHVLLARDSLALLAASGVLHADVPSSTRFDLGADDAVAIALSQFLQKPVRAGDVELSDTVDGGGYRRAQLPPRDDLVVQHLRARPVLAAVAAFVVEAWLVEVAAHAEGVRVAHTLVVDARSGVIRSDVDLRHDAAFTYRVWADESGQPLDSPLGDTTPYPAAAPDGHYPAVVAPRLVSMDAFNAPQDPWLPDGATETRGNNVDAFTDDANPVGFGPGDLRASTTSPGVFDHSYDPAVGPQDNDEQRMASATSLFYLVNWLHDVWYDAGFDEAAHNAQSSNYGRGGAEQDPILALAQYAAPDARDNSAMEPFDDGASPQMDMFVWSGAGTVSLTAGSGALDFNLADFGPSSFNVTADAVVVDDGEAPTADACSAIANDLTGRIALIDRGACFFVDKVLAAQAAGAVGVIIIDNTGSNQPPPLFGGNNVPVEPTIPAMSIRRDDGSALRASLEVGPVSIAMVRAGDVDRDGAFDTTVAAHEWGHYLHLRQVLCEAAQCSAQSEGWGDFVALHTTMREADALDGAYAVGTFATAAFPDDPAYFGIRRFPYSTDLGKNPLTFRHIADSAQLPTTAPIAASSAQAPNSEVHAAGEVWAQMMFEAWVALLERTRGDAPAYDFAEAHRRMADAVELGMQLAPPSPTWTEQRDAVLAGAASRDPEDAAAMARAFAKRGAGTCAVSPARDSEDFEGVVEDFAVGDNLVVTSVALVPDGTGCDGDAVLDAGERGVIRIVVQNNGTNPTPAAHIALSSTSPGVALDASTIEVAALAPFNATTLTVGVALAVDAPSLSRASVTARIVDAAACAPDGVTTAPLTNGDDAPDGLTTETFEGSTLNWSLLGDYAELIWTPTESAAGVDGGNRAPGNHVISGADAPVPTDTALVSPPLHVAADADFVVHFVHRHSFESGQGSNYDGGVVELSTDGGQTWQDAATHAEPGYEGTIGDANNQASNALKGRDGYVGDNPSLPDFDSVTLDFQRAYAGQTVQLRFRIATDEGTGAGGWEIDDIDVEGIDNAPFSGLRDNVTTCAGVPGAEGEGEGEGVGDSDGDGIRDDYVLGGGGCVSCNASGVEFAAPAALLALLRVVRRRRR